MTQNRLRAVHLAVLFLLALPLFYAAPALAQDVITVGTATANGSTVDVPVYIRDSAGTSLGRDQNPGLKIQAYSITVSYSPAASVQSVTFSRAGITAGLNPAFETTSSPAGSIVLLDSFDESTELIPFTLNAPGNGDQVAHLVFTLSSSAAPGSSIALTLVPSQNSLSSQSGSPQETQGNGGLTLVNGAINIAQIALNIISGSRTVAVGDSVTMIAQASANVSSSTTITLTSSAPSIATVPSTVTIPTGSSFANFQVTGVAIGDSTITGTLPPASGSGSGTALISVIAAPPPCDTPGAPQISGPTTAEVGSTYAISWAAVSSATDYVVDESTDPNFGTVMPTITTSTSASFTHSAANRYYYRVRARNLSIGCNTTSTFASSISVLVSVTPVPQTRILPVVGSTPGSNGSNFKTAVQLYNPRSSAISGKIVFHTQNASASASDPSLAFSIQAGKSLSYADLLPAMGIAIGLGSADLIADAGSAFPITLLRVFNDAGTAGTTGLAEEPMLTTDALKSGDAAVLIAPADTRFRLNIGVRTLEQGASMTLTVHDKDGVLVKTSTRTYGPTFFQQVGSSTILDGYVLIGGETISVQITAGSAFVYGSTTDNTTQDPSVQFARKVE
jgi:uncharacterized protein YjdB